MCILVYHWIAGTNPKFHFAGVYVFLTIWGQTLQTLYFLVATISSIMLVRDVQGVSSDWIDDVAVNKASGGARLLYGNEGISSMPFEDPEDVTTSRVFEDEDDIGGRRMSRYGDGDDVVGPYSDFCSQCPCWSSPVPGRSGLGRVSRVLAPWTLFAIAARDRLFSLEIVVAAFVSFGFWCLIFPAASTQHIFHTDAVAAAMSVWDHGATFVLAVAELLCVRHRYPRGRLLGILLTTGFAALYCAWNVITREENGVWPYPNVQEPLIDLGVGVEVAVYAAGVLAMGVLWAAGRWLSVGPVWGGSCCSGAACCCCCFASCCGSSLAAEDPGVTGWRHRASTVDGSVLGPAFGHL